jgi:hypothetical protein
MNSLVKSLNVTLALAVVAIYLFVTAPPPLEAGHGQGGRLPIDSVLAIAEQENDRVRALYAREIVGAGKKAGLGFDEHWRDQEVEAGPLPAQFLRQTATSLERSRVRLGLYLGSDYPINQSNLFSGQQAELFQQLKATRQPQYTYVEDAGLYAYMFPDVAIAESCVQCHNEHEQSPWTEWKADDIMGATTWTYPSDSVSVEEALMLLEALRAGFRDAYAVVLEKMQSISRPPEIGERWPADGYYLPSVETFMAVVDQRASAATLAALRELVNTGQTRVAVGGQ